MKQIDRNYYTGVPIRFILIVLLLLTVLAGPAVADQYSTWTLQGVTFADGGIATGSFTVDTTLYNNASLYTTVLDGDPHPGFNGSFAIVAVDIQISYPVSSYGDYHYTDSGSAVVWRSASNSFESVEFSQRSASSREFNHTFTLAYGPGVGELAGSAVISVPGSYYAYLNEEWNPTETFGTTGQLVPAAVPEPTSMLLIGLGLIGLAGIRRKFKV
jgi:hypothetical protein